MVHMMNGYHDVFYNCNFDNHPVDGVVLPKF